MAVDPLDRIVVGGYTASSNFPVANALPPTRGGTGSDLDGFVARLSASGTSLDYSTYLGGASEDLVLGLVPASGFGLYVLGVSSSAAPVSMQSAGGGAAIDGTLGGSKDAFVARLDVGPTVTSITPASGSTTGGTAVTISGLDFLAGSTVTIGGAAATGVLVASATTIQATTPAHAPGVVSVSVVNPDAQSATLASAFTYATDFDNDGASNRKEFEDGTDPNVAVTRFFAEGYTAGGFSTRFALLNDDPTRTASVTFEFLVKFGPVVTATRTIPPLRRLTLDAAADVPGLADVEFSTSIRSNLEIAADRTMTWDRTTYGAHAETAVAAPASTWYLAEGATINNLQLFYLIQNPNSVPVDVRVRYLLSGSAPVEAVVTIGAKFTQTVSRLLAGTERVRTTGAPCGSRDIHDREY